ncbi:MAG: AAA family ATPase [Alphaproteobacteria bacterium]|nr:AAA family ATPase [Alphaproteobacteria bacterium]
MEPIVLERLELRAVRGIPELTLDFQAPEPGRGQWTVLLGENGSGKTTILQAVAKALRPRSEDGAVPCRGVASREYTLHLAEPSGRSQWRTLPSNAKNIERAETTFPAVGRDVLGYGSRRGGALGGPDRDVSFDPPVAGELDRVWFVPSLFDPNARLIHAETWLRNREHAALKSGGGAPQAFFESVVQTVLALLPGIESLEVGSDEVTVRGPAVRECALADLADGYLTTLGWTLDFIARWSHVHADLVDGDFRDRMVALVLVDEIDLHLHPRWQRTILQEIRDTFPVTSFVVTTHNPLTIQGARPGEVHVLRRHDDGSVTSRQIDPPLGADVDDLLTGPWFGLSTTYDPDTVEKLREHADLLRRGTPRDDAGRQELESTLRDRLSVFGATPEDRELLEEAAKSGLEGLAGKLSRIRAARK